MFSHYCCLILSDFCLFVGLVGLGLGLGFWERFVVGAKLVNDDNDVVWVNVVMSIKINYY